jgi:hypothetical protein
MGYMKHANSSNGCSRQRQPDSGKVEYEHSSLSMASIIFREKSDPFVPYSWNCRIRKLFQMEWFLYSEVRRSIFQTCHSQYATKPAWRSGLFSWSPYHEKLFIDSLSLASLAKAETLCHNGFARLIHGSVSCALGFCNSRHRIRSPP